MSGSLVTGSKTSTGGKREIGGRSRRGVQNFGGGFSCSGDMVGGGGCVGVLPVNNWHWGLALVHSLDASNYMLYIHSACLQLLYLS